MMCRLLDLSTSGFYAFSKRKESKKKARRREVGKSIAETFVTFKKRYGAPRITLELNAQGIPCSRNYVALIMRENGLQARNGKKFRYTSPIEASTAVSMNILSRKFDVAQPNIKWVSDITYIRVGHTWLYLAVVIDLFSKKVVGWSLRKHMRESLIIEALNMAISCRDIKKGLVLHSDRGVQYRANEYQQLMKDHGVLCSMSRKGNCWDNAVAESFFSRFKVELIYAECYKTIKETQAGVFEYIEMFYNRQRRHSANGYISPHEFEQKYN